MYKVTCFLGVVAVALWGGCGLARHQAPLSYEAKMRQAEEALEKERVLEARKWAREALQERPGNPEAEKLMARVIALETAREKSLTPMKLPEEFGAQEKAAAIKTWLERSQSFLQLNQFDEALQAAEQVFLLDPENLEASRLVDQIKQKAREQGYEENAFVQKLYQEEVDQRIALYQEQAETALKNQRWASARFAIEKILLLDPENAKGKKLLTLVEKQEKAAPAPIS